MEAFSLLKYWRSGGAVVVPGIGAGAAASSDANPRATTIVTTVAQNAVETDDEDGDDDGPFFDLEFAVPDDEDGDDKEGKAGSNGAVSGEEYDGADESSDDDVDGTDGEREFNFTLSSGSSNERGDQNLALSPSDDLFFKGRLVPMEPSSLEFNGSEPNLKPQFPVSLLKSATKFRVFLLGLKTKMNNSDKPDPNVCAAAVAVTSPKQEAQKPVEKEEETAKQSKLLTVKFKVEEVPIVSLLTRENSKSTKSAPKQSCDEPTAVAGDEKRFSKDVMNKYLKKVKPLYVRVSKRYGDKLKFSGQLSLGSSGPKQPALTQPVTAQQKSSPGKSTAAEKIPPEAAASVEAPVNITCKGQKQGNLPAGLREVCKHLGKSRSASSAAVAAAPPVPTLSQRRDDSLLQQQDGIQSAILHCKRSFNASRDSESTLLSRSVSDPSHEKPLKFSGKIPGVGKSS